MCNKFWDEGPNAKHVAENLPYLEGDGKAIEQATYNTILKFSSKWG